MKLIDDWKRAHKLWSVRMAAVLTFVSTLDWALPQAADLLPRWAYVALSVSVLVARLIQQERK